jgi:hypothetical protein
VWVPRQVVVMHRTGHILLLHHSEGERMRYVADWFAAGVATDDLLVYVDVDGRGAEALTADLVARGFGAERALRDGRQEIVSLEDLPGVRGCRDGRVSVPQGFAGVRLALRADAVARCLDPAAYRALEHDLARLCRRSRVSVLCQYDGRTTGRDQLAVALALHPDWVCASDLSLRHRDHVIQVEGLLSMPNAALLARSLGRMTEDLGTDKVLALDLRQADALTPGACEALLEGTRGFRERGGHVRCGLPPDRAWGRVLSHLLSPDDDSFELA